MRILISAGEASGEMYGAQLIEALKRCLGSATDHVGTAASGRAPLPARFPPDGVVGCPVERNSATTRTTLADKNVRATRTLELFGVGGEKMRAAGCDIVVDSKDLAVVGITEILSHLPKIWGLFHKLIAEADRRKPDLAVVIDSPAFNWRVAREMKKRGIPVVYYVCPQFWAWRQGRVRLLRKYVDKALVIFPFEEKFYRDRGVDAEFVGHPLAELLRPSISKGEYAAQQGLDPEKTWITLMPGSRMKEVRMNLPTILESARLLGSDYEFLLPIAPTLDCEFVQSLIGMAQHGKGTTSSRAVNASAMTVGTAGSRALPGRNPVEGIGSIYLVPESLPALAHSRAGIIASGTATVEAALMDLPFVMVYRVTPLTYLLGRSTVKVPHFAMVNLIAGEQIIPELIQDDFTSEKVVGEIKKIIAESDARRKMLKGLAESRARLKGPEQSALPAAERAAKTILSMLLNQNIAEAR